MKCYYLGDKKITEAEAKEIEAKNREILRDGTVEELYYKRDYALVTITDPVAQQLEKLIALVSKKH